MKLKIHDRCRYLYLQNDDKKDMYGIRFDIHSKDNLDCKMYGRFLEIGLGINNTSPDMFWVSDRLRYNKSTINSLVTEYL